MLFSRRLANLVTIPALARTQGIPRRTLFYRLVRIHARDRKNGHPEWMTRDEPGSPWKVNLGLLRAAHPEYFEVDESPYDVDRQGLPPWVTRLIDDIQDLKKSQNDTKRHQNALGARVRELTAWARLGKAGQGSVAGS